MTARTAIPNRARPERFALRVVKGGFQPADATTRTRLAARKYRMGELVFAEFKRPRNPGFHRLAHALGTLFVENIEAFEGLNAHTCLKRLQLESGIGCEEVGVPFRYTLPTRAEAWVREHMGDAMADLYRAFTRAFFKADDVIPLRIPRSLSFESMEQGEFQQVVAGLCAHVSKNYWTGCTPEEIEEMAKLWVDPC